MCRVFAGALLFAGALSAARGVKTPPPGWTDLGVVPDSQAVHITMGLQQRNLDQRHRQLPREVLRPLEVQAWKKKLQHSKQKRVT